MSLPLVRKPVSPNNGGEFSGISDFALGKNKIINGNFDFWQRGTSSTTGSASAGGSAYLADRFKWNVSAGGGTSAAFTVSRQSFTLGQTEVPNEPVYFWRVTNTTQGTSLGALSYHVLQHQVESVRSLAGKKVTLSFWARSTISSKQLMVAPAQYFGGGGSPSANVHFTAQIITLNANWTKHTLTFDVPSISGKSVGTSSDGSFDINFFVQGGSSLAALYGTSAVSWQGTGNVDIAQIMLNEGEVAGDFALAGGYLGGELALCQRYYEKSYDVNTNPGTNTSLNGPGIVDANWPSSTAGMIAKVYFRTQKRTIPTIAVYADTGGNPGVITINGASGNVVAPSNVDTNGETGFKIFHGNAISRMTFHWTADAEIG